MTEVPIHHVYTYNDTDRAFWAEHLEDWVPRRLIDSHVHSADPRFKIETITEEMKRRCPALGRWRATKAWQARSMARTSRLMGKSPNTVS